MTKKKAIARASIIKGSCQMFASFQMACPLCKVVIPANTHHTCRKG